SRIDPAAERTLLLTGETGAGKEIAALEYLRRLRERSGRRDLVLEHENLAHGEHLRFRLCGAWPGSFADTDRKDGVLRRAGRGIAFLDEVGELPLEAQAELLTFLQPRRDGRMYVTPEGEPPAGSRSGGLPVECTVVFGTNRDLDARVAEGLFRLDLLQRISHYRRRIPPLRERREDIPLLLRQALRERGVPDDHWISPDLLAGLLSHPLPGNARSLNRLAAHLRLAGEDRITDPFRTRSDLTGRYHTFRDLPGEVLEEILGRSAAPDRGLAGSEAQPRPEPRTEAEMVRLLQDAGNSAAGALRLMGRVASNRTAFYRLLDRFGVPHNETDRTRWLRDRTAASPEDVPGT
ncbi:MAG: sigma 54-interacting transcriptional regulator, partial [Deltaproteobacteria bacterium]|nr:sigma 54-interacting transcriptional regulator [Deltaproteobacteria bacterium]